MCMSPVKIKVPDTNLHIFNRDLQQYIEVPCGKCDECRVSHAKEWAVRCMCEYFSYSEKERERCWFLTLTYDDAHNTGFLAEMDVRLFIKRLRSLPEVRNKLKIKYFYCGEYGSLTLRPHYHMIVYNLPIDDLVKIKKDLFTSEKISKCWGHGIISIGFVTLQSCNYVARYALKKNDTDCFIRMSQGFGKKYFLQNMKDIVTNNFITLPKNDKIVKCAIPRYFRKVYRQLVGENEYESWILWRQKMTEKYFQAIEKKFSLGVEKFDYITRRRLGIRSKAVKLSQKNKDILRESYYDFAKFRDIM